MEYVRKSEAVGHRMLLMHMRRQ